MDTTYQDRVRAEHEELCNRVHKLAAFMTDHLDEISPEENGLLMVQLSLMAQYQFVLDLRIRTFKD